MEININKARWYTYGVSICIILGLVARDIFGVNISKYLLLLLAMCPIFLLDIKRVVIFSCFIIPLYVGLPGNFISVLLLIRLLYETLKKRIKIFKNGFLLTFFLVIYIVLQDLFTGYTEIYHLMAALDFVILSLVMSILREYKVGTKAVIAYSVGNFIIGIVMLFATLSYYSLQDLMNPATRLGYTGMLIGNTGSSMATSIDPNFYAMNTIACISTVTLLFQYFESQKEKILALSSIIGSTLCCLVGLSRTFIILLIIWWILWMINQENLKKNLMLLFLITVVCVVFFCFMPTIVNGLFTRFESSDLAGGNGRINLIILYFEPWFETLLSILFGIGLFNCHTHCAPLMYLFGLGIIGSFPLASWFFYQWNRFKKCSNFFNFKSKIPMLLTLMAYSTIPAAGAINYTLPLLIPMIAFAIPNKLEDSNE